MSAASETASKYWAFISYSHRDARWGDWLHKGLETFRVPRQLVGRETREGVVPARIFPVFRDREELPTSSDLGEMLRDALVQSRYLVVICSQNSARSKWVNEEILEYKRMGRSNRILCIIVDGEPNASEKPDVTVGECFPEAIRYHMGPDGALSESRAEPIAADARPQGDGRHDARLKVIAGLLGVGFDQLKQRELQRRQRRLLITAAVSMVIAALTIGLAIVAAVARQEAVFQRGEAQAAQGEAEEQRDVARQQYTTLCVAKGWRQYIDGDKPAALLWFAEALLKQPGDMADQRNHRVRVAGLLGELARLDTAWPMPYASDVVLSPQRDRMVVVDRTAATARILDVNTGRVVLDFGQVDEAPFMAAYQADGQRLLTSERGGIRLRDRDGRPLKVLPVGAAETFPTLPARWLIARDDTFVGVLADGRAYLWDADREVFRRLDADLPDKFGFSFSRDHRLMAVFDIDDVRVLDLESGAIVARWRHDVHCPPRPDEPLPAPGPPSVMSVWFSRDNSLAFVAGFDGAGQLRDLHTGRAVSHDPMVHEDRITVAAFSPDDQGLIVGDWSGACSVWSTVNGALTSRSRDRHRPIDDVRVETLEEGVFILNVVVEIVAPTGRTRIIPIRPTSRLLVRESDDRLITVCASWLNDKSGHIVQVWALPQPRRPLVELVHDAEIMMFEASADGTRIVAVDWSRVARLWDAETGEMVAELRHPVDPDPVDPLGRPFPPPLGVYHVAFSQDGTQVLTVGDDRAVRLWDGDSGEPTGVVVRQEKAIESASFSPDGRLIGVVADSDSKYIDTLSIWRNDADATAAEHRFTIEDDEGYRQSLECFQFSPDGSVVAAAASNGTVQCWSVDTGQPVGPALAHSGSVDSIDFSPDGTRLATACYDNAARVWLLDGTLVCATPVVEFNALNSVAFSPDGTAIVTASDDARLRVWDAGTAEPLVKPMPHSGPVGRASFSPEGTMLLSTADFGMHKSVDHTARLWDARSGEPVVVEFPHQVGMETAAMVADASRLVTAYGDRVMIWDIAPDRRAIDAIVDEARSLATRFIDDSGGDLLLSEEELLEIVERADAAEQ